MLTDRSAQHENHHLMNKSKIVYKIITERNNHEFTYTIMKLHHTSSNNIVLHIVNYKNVLLQLPFDNQFTWICDYGHCKDEILLVCLYL